MCNPFAAGVLLITATTEASSLASRSAFILLPRPEMRMTMRFIAISEDQCLRFASTPDAYFANAENRFSFALERLNGSIGMFLRNDDDHADATIEYAVHFRIGQFAVFLKPVE